MTRSIAFLDRAISDIAVAIDWYERQQKGLGIRFEKSIFEIVDEIAKFPYAFPNKNKLSRETVLSKFPYVIIYRFDKKTVYIQAVFPAKMHPNKKYSK